MPQQPNQIKQNKLPKHQGLVEYASVMAVTYTAVSWEKEHFVRVSLCQGEANIFFLIYLNLIKKFDILECAFYSFYKPIVVRNYGVPSVK